MSFSYIGYCFSVDLVWGRVVFFYYLFMDCAFLLRFFGGGLDNKERYTFI